MHKSLEIFEKYVEHTWFIFSTILVWNILLADLPSYERVKFDLSFESLQVSVLGGYVVWFVSKLNFADVINWNSPEQNSVEISTTWL